MKRSSISGARTSSRRRTALATALAGSLFIIACGGGDGDSAVTNAPESESSEAPPSSALPSTEADIYGGPPTGPEMIVGLINTEGTPGLDFPNMRRFIESAVAWTNENSGMGGRPIKLETCIVKGSPETSQACAQELVGKNVELILLGFDLFPDYKTFEAAKLPVIGVLPILAPDYTANALFLTGGNATLGGAIAAVAKDTFNASTVSMVHSDNAGANSTAASFQAALEKAGIAWTAVKGGDNETDAGYQGLMREAAKTNPDVIVSLYTDAGCIGTMRGRASLGITIPVITTSACADKSVIDVVGDDALGWVFAGLAEDVDTPDRLLQRELLAPVLGVTPQEVTVASLGLNGLGYSLYMSLVDYANQMNADGLEVTGQSLFDYLKAGVDLFLFGGQSPIECGSSEKYPSVCSYVFPFAEYKGDGVIGPVDGLGLVDSKPYLP